MCDLERVADVPGPVVSAPELQLLVAPLRAAALEAVLSRVHVQGREAGLHADGEGLAALPHRVLASPGADPHEGLQGVGRLPDPFNPRACTKWLLGDGEHEAQTDSASILRLELGPQ